MSGLINDQLLNNLRNVAYRQLVTTVVIERGTDSQTTADTKFTWAAVASTTGWLVGINSPDVETGVGNRAIISNAYELRLRQGTNVQPGDRCLIGGAYYIVQDVNSEVTISLFLKARLRRDS